MPLSNRLTPSTEAYMQQQAAIGDSNQNAEQLDIVGQQQEAQQKLRQQLKDQEAATARAQREQVALQRQQEAARKAQIAAAQRAGVKTQVDATGTEQIQRNEDNTPVFEHGFQGEPQQTPDGEHVVKYRTPRGEIYTVPTKGIRTTQDPTGNSLYEFDTTKPDGTKETIRQPVGAKPLWQTDPKTGDMYTGAPDPITGSYGQTKIGIDRTVAGKAAIQRQKEAFAQKEAEMKYQSEETNLLQNVEETNLKPLKTALSEAQDAYDKLAKDKIQFKQTPAGLARVVDYGNGPQEVLVPSTDTAAISSAQAWINQKAVAEKRLAEAKAAHEPVAAQVLTLQQQRDKLALDTLHASHEAQKQLKAMEEAYKAGIPVHEPDWQKRVNAARTDPRITGIVTQGNLDEQGGPLAEDVRTVALPETTKLLNRAFANASPVVRSGLLPDGTQAQPEAAAGVPMARPGLNLLNQVMDGIAADNTPVKDADVRTLTTQALGITNPEKWEARPSEGVMGEMGYHELFTDGERVGRFNTKANRIELDNPTNYSNQVAKQQQRLLTTNKNGLPIYFAGAEQAMTKPQLRDLVQTGIDITRSTTDPQEAETKLAEVGLSPAALRQKVMEGKISVQDGRLFNETFHGLSDVDGTEEGVTRAFSKHLASPVLGAKFKNGDLAAKQQVVNQFMDAYAERAGSNIIAPSRSDLAAMRAKLLAKTDTRGMIGKTVDGALGMPKQIIAPLAGMIVEAASVPLYYGPRKLLGYKDKETDLIWNGSADLIQRQVNASNFMHRLFGQGEMKSILDDVKAWADKAQVGEELPAELDNKLSSAAYDGYFQFTDKNAQDVNTSRDTFSVNKTPALKAALQRYLTTADGTAFDGMLQLLSMTGNDRATQQQTMEYLERPQAATADTVIDRAKLLDIKLDAGRAASVLDIGRRLDTATKDPAQYRNLINEAGKVLGLESPADVQMALSHLTRQETDDPNSWRALFRAGTVANVGEFATEALSDVATGVLTASVMGAPAAGAIKGAQVSARQGLKRLLSPVSAIRDKAAGIIGGSLDALAEKSARFASGRARLSGAFTEAADKYRRLGIVHPTFGAPLTTAQKARNTAVGLAKSAVAAAPIEAVEEGTMALLDAAPTPENVVDSMIQGAMGGTVLVPMFAGASALNRAWTAGKRNQSITDFKAGLVGKFNDRMAGQSGFTPLTVEDFDIMQGIQDNPAHQTALADHAVALDELAAAQEEHTAAVIEMQDAAAGNAVADAPPSPRLLTAQNDAQQTSDYLTGLASVAFSATDELRALPADQRPLYTGIAKATSGATDYTVAEAQALMKLGGQNAVAFQQAQVLPADVAVPAQVVTLPGAPAVSQTVLGTYRLPAGVRVQVPQQAIESLYERAPSLRGLISPAAPAMPQAQAATVSPAPAQQAQPQSATQSVPTQQPAPTVATGDVAVPAQSQAAPPAATTAVQPAVNTPAIPAVRAAENITRQVIGAVAAKSPKLKSLIKEAKKPNAYPTGGFWMKPDGTIAYHMPSIVEQLAGRTPQEISQQVAALLDEEIRHSANMAAAERLWQDKTINPLGVGFAQWRDAWYGDIWLNHFTQEMRDRVQEAYGDTLPKQDWMRAMEGLRMLDQLRATGSITESVLHALDAVLAALREFLSLVTAGSKPVVQREIDNIAAVLQEFGYENGAVQPEKAKKKAAKPRSAKKPQESTENSAKTPKSSTQLTLSRKDAAPILAFGESIPKDELSPEIIAEDGTALETEPHVTVLYGLTKHEADPVAKTIAGHGPVTVTLGKMSLFENEDYDVLKIDVESPELRVLNAKLSKLPNENNFPDYKPHMTIAYLKKGEGKKYVGNDQFEGKKITFETMTFSPPSELRGELGKPELPLNSQAIQPATNQNNTTDENTTGSEKGNGQGRQGEQGQRQDVLSQATPAIIEPAAPAPDNGRGAVPSTSAASIAKIQSAFDGLASAPVASAQDEEYMRAVQSGDVAKQQVMVDAAAKDAGYTTPALHGTSGNWTVFDPRKIGSLQRQDFGRGIYLAPTTRVRDAEMYARQASEQTGFPAKVLRLWVKITNPLIGQNYAEEGSNLTGSAKERGKDGVIVKYDRGEGRIGDVSEIIVFDPSQIKSANPITRDEQGNVIPLSQRFNPESDSILRSSPVSAQLGLPKERRAAFLDVAESLIADGVETPAGLAAALTAARPDGSLVKYSQALWNFFSTIKPELTGQHDWQAIYAANAKPAAEVSTEPGEMAPTPIKDPGEVDNPINEPRSTQQADKKAPRKPKKPALADLLAAYFIPGKVVKSYGGFDRVISLDATNPNQWNVTVQEVRQTGGAKLNNTTSTQGQINAASWEDAPNSQPRTHQTLPSQKELDAAWKSQQEAGNLASAPIQQTQTQKDINEIKQQLEASNAGRGDDTVSREWLDKQAESLLQWGVRNNRTVTPEEIANTFNSYGQFGSGAEHDVWYDPATNRVLKLTKGREFGIQKDLTRYLDTLEGANQLFGDDIKLEGVVPIRGWPHILTSQPFYSGRTANQSEIAGYFNSLGFTPYQRTGSYSKGRTLVYDALPRNVLKLEDSSLQPIDVQVYLASAPARGYRTPTGMLEATKAAMQGNGPRAALSSNLFKPQAPAAAQPQITPRSMLDAYRAATVGKSSAMVPIKDVFEKAKAANNKLTVEEFQRQLAALDDGRAYFGLTETTAAYDKAKPFVYGPAGVEMSFDPELIKASTILSNLDRVKEKRALLANEQDAYDRSLALLASNEAPPVTHMLPDGYALTAEGMQTLNSAPIRAHHGTPHKVKKFSLDNIGSGEGVQAYGWGLYFAAAEDVAAKYRDMLDQSYYSVDGKKRVPENPRHSAAVAIAEAGGDVTKAIEQTRQKIARYRQTTDKLKLGAADGLESILLPILENDPPAPAVLQNAPNLYTVDLLPNEDEFLDWDKPLHAQSDKVKEALLGSGLWSERNLNEKTSNPLHTGAFIYEVHGAASSPNEVGTNGKAASANLLALGIPGIRYLDGNSRSDGTGTYNYVLFDENLVRIVAENGKPVSDSSAVLASAPVNRGIAPDQGIGQAEAMASNSGAAQNAEPSQGGLSEAEVFKQAFKQGFTIKSFGGHADGITQFVEKNKIDRDGIWFSDTLGMAQSYAEWKVEGDDERPEGVAAGTVYDVFLKMANPYIFDMMGFSASEVNEVTDAFGEAANTEDIVAWAFHHGYDGVIINNVADYAASGYGDKTGIVYVVKNGNQIKSSDRITRDDQGNIIPIKYRFDSGPDIRGDLNWKEKSQTSQAAALNARKGQSLADTMSKSGSQETSSSPPEVNPESSRAEGGTLASAPIPDTDKQARIREIVESMPPTWQNVLRDTWAGKSIEEIAQARGLKLEAVRNVQAQALGRFKVLMEKGAAPKVKVQVENGAVKAAGGRPDLALSGNAAVAAVDQRRMSPEEVTHADMQEAAAQMFAVDPAAAEKLVTRWMDSGTTVLSTAGMPEGIQRIVDAAQARMAAEMLMTAAAKLLVTEKALQGGNSLETARLIDLYRNTGTEQARALNMRRDPHDTPEERAAMYLSETLLTPPQSIRDEMKKNPANKERILAAWAKQADKIKADMLAAGIDLDATFREMAKEKKLAEETIPEPVKQPLARAPKKTRQLVKAVLEGKTWQEAINAAGLTLAAARAAYNGFRAELNKIAANAAAQARDEMLRSAPVVDFAAGLGLPEWTDAVDLNQNAVKTAATEKLRLQRERKKAGGEIDLKNPLSVNRTRRLIEERKSTFFDKISEYWRASILSGPQTHVVNIVSGLTFGTYEATFKKLAAGVQADITRMFGMKPDAASLADIPAMIAGALPAIKLAYLDSISSWKSETGLFDSYAMNLTSEDGALFKEGYSPALKGKLGKLMRGISFRLMGAADEFVKSFFTRIEVAAQARQIARNEGKTGAAMANAISELMVPGSLAWERALAQSKRITFQDEEVRSAEGAIQLRSPLQAGSRSIDTLDHVADLISRTKKGDFGRALKGLSHFTFPFVSTPTNIFKAGVTMSPVGGLLAIIDATRSLHRRKQGNVEEAQRIYNAARALDDITNQIVAWGFILGLSAMVKPGDDEDELPFITGTIPWRTTAPGEREIAYRTAPPQSIRIGDKWYSYKRLDPFASALAFTIDAIREFQSGKPIDEVWGKVGMGMMTNLQDKTFLQGVSDLVNAVQDPQRFGTKWATNIAIGFLPNLLRQPARTSDSVFRENDLPNDMGFWEVMERRIGFGLYPAAGNPLAPIPAVDIWGRPAAKNTGTGGPNTDWMMRLFSPVEMRDASQPDPLDVALLRYNMTHDEPFGVSAPSRELQKTMDGKPVKISLQDPEYLEFVTSAGRAARAAIGDMYNGRDLTEDDVDAIKKVISKVQSEYRNQIFFAELAKRPPSP